MDVPQSSHTAPRSRPLGPFAQMAARRQQSTSNEKPKQRGPSKGSKYRQRGLQLAEIPTVLSVRLLMLLAPAFSLIAFAQGKRARRKAERFEDKQPATRLQEDQHNLKTYNKKYVNLKDVAELTSSKPAAEDCTPHPANTHSALALPMQLLCVDGSPISEIVWCTVSLCAYSHPHHLKQG